MPPVRFTWYDGGLKPADPKNWKTIVHSKDKVKKMKGSSLSEMRQDSMHFQWGNPTLIPQSKMDSYKQPPKTLPRSPGNEREWLNACKGTKVKPGGNFEFEGMVTETLLLGNVAVRSGQTLHWDHANLKANNSDFAQNYIRPERRADGSFRFNVYPT